MRIRWLGIALLAAALGRGAAGGETAEERYDFARGLHARGLYAQAASEYSAFLKDFGKHQNASDARFGLGECLFSQGRHDEAAKVLEGLRSKGFARSAELSLRLGQCRYLEGKHDEAVKLLRASLAGKLAKDLADAARYFLARSLMELGQHEEARKVLAEGAKGKAPLLALAESRSAAGEHAEALKISRQLLGAELSAPVRAEVRFRAAESLRAMGNFSEAANEYATLLKAQPGGVLTAAGKLGMAWTELGRGRTAEALRLAREIRSSPATPQLSDEARYLEAVVTGRLGRHEAAAALLGRLAADTTGESRRRAMRARMWELHRAGKPDEAKRAAVAFTKDYPGDGAAAATESKYILAEAELALGAHEKALALFKEVAAQKAALSTEAAFGAASTLAAMGRHKEAAEAFDDFAGANREHAMATAALVASGREYLKVKDHAAAEGIFSQVARSDKLSAEFKAAAQWGLALAASAKGDDDLAARRFEEFAEKLPGAENAPEALLWLGWHRTSKGALAGSIDVYEKLIRIYPDTPAAAEARYRLGLACQKAGRLDRAASLFDELRKVRPDRLPGEVHLWLADHWRSKGDTKKAVAVLEGLSETTREPELRQRALFSLGEVLLGRKSYGKSAAAFDKLLKDFPRGKYVDAARLRKGTAARLSNRLDEAEVLLENVVRSAEGLARARAHTELGLVKIAREQPEEALREFLRVVVLYEPTDSGEGAGVWGLASLSAARAAARLGRREEAKRLLRVLLAQKRCSETPAFSEGKKMLADLEMR